MDEIGRLKAIFHDLAASILYVGKMAKKGNKKQAISERKAQFFLLRALKLMGLRPRKNM